MNFRENKIGLWIGVLVAVMVVGLFKLLGGSPEKTASQEQDITYEMPRPKGEVIGEFGLGDREIDRQYVNPFEKKKAEEEAARKAAQAKAAALQGKPVAQSAASGTAQNARRPMVLVNYVDANRKGLSGDNGRAKPAVSDEPQAPVNRVAAGAADDNNDNKLSPDQWRALMSAQPTKENMKKLVDAYLKHDVDDGTFYGIVEELLKNSNAEKQSVAFYGLNMVPSSKSFALVANMESTFTTETEKKQADDYLNSFAVASRQSALLMSVQSNDKDVSLRAAQVVLMGLKSGPPGREPTQGRDGNQASNVSSSGWARFTAIFKRWAASGDPALQGPASQILPLLGSTNA